MNRRSVSLAGILVLLAATGSQTLSLSEPIDRLGASVRLTAGRTSFAEARGMPAPASTRGDLPTLLAPHGARSITWEETAGIDGGYICAMATTARGTLLAGTEGGLFRSVDGGDSWQVPAAEIPWPCCNYNVPSFAVTAAAVYAGTWGGGVLRSDDDGETWLPTSPIPDEGYPIAQALAACRYGEDVYAGGNFGVVHSADGGASWTTLNDGLPAGWVKSLALRGTALYAMLDSGIYRFDPESLTWSAWNEGLYATTGQQALGLVDDALFLATHAGGVFHLDCSDSEWIAMNDGLWSHGVDVVIEAGERLYAGLMGDAVMRWDPSTLSWSWIGAGFWNGDVRTMTGRGAKPYAGTYGAGVFRFDPDAEAWNHKSAGIRAPLLEAIVAEGSTVHAGLFGGGVYTSTDNGDSWTLTIDGLGHPFVLVLARDNVGGVYAGTWNGVWRLEDQQTTWEAAGLQGHGVFSMIFAGSALYAGTYGGGVYVSTDHGQSWNPVGAGLPQSCIWSIERIGSTLYAAVGGNGVYRLLDGQTNWTSMNSGLPGLDLWCLESRAGSLYVGLEQHGVCCWNPGTGVWDAAGLENNTIFCLADIGTGLMAGTHGALYYTTDGGETWANENEGLKPWSAVLALASSEEKIFAGLASAGVWRASRDPGAVEPPLEVGPRPLSKVMEVHPNPSTGEMRIAFQIGSQQEIRLGVFDATGRRVATLLSGLLPAGVHETIWSGMTESGAKVSSGVYMIRLEADGREVTSQAIRLR